MSTRIFNGVVYLFALIGAGAVVYWMDRNAPWWWCPALTLLAFAAALTDTIRWNLNHRSTESVRQCRQATQPDCAAGLSLGSTPLTPPRHEGRRAPTFH